MVVPAPGMLALHLRIDTVEQPCKVRVWDDEVPAPSTWATRRRSGSRDFLGQRSPLRAPGVRFDPDVRRLSSLQWTAGVEAPNQFSDGYPLLVTSEASLDGLNRRLAQRRARLTSASSAFGPTSCWPVWRRMTRTAWQTCALTPADAPVKRCCVP
jgi:uncharacterized protein YcbX